MVAVGAVGVRRTWKGVVSGHGGLSTSDSVGHTAACLPQTQTSKISGLGVVKQNLEPNTEHLEEGAWP